MALLDTIKQNLSRLGDQRQAGAVGLGTTAAAQRMLQAGTGKAEQAGVAPATSTIGEQVAVQQTQQQLAQVGEQAQLAGAELEQRAATQQSREQLATEELTQRRNNFLNQYYRESSSVLSQLERERDKMSQEEQLAKMEQVGFTLKLADEQYIYALQDQGRRQRLDSESGFRISLQEAINADMVDLFKDNIEWQKAFDMSEREYTDWLASIDLNKAIELADAQEKADRISAAANLGTTAVSATTKYYSGKEPAEEDISDLDKNQYDISTAESRENVT
jgi:hypothetical protein